MHAALSVLSIAACVGGNGTPLARMPAADAAAASAERLAGFVDLYWQQDTGKLLVGVRALDAVLSLKTSLDAADPVEPERRAWRRLASRRIDRALDDPASIGERPAVSVPPGSPIGMAPDSCDHGVAMPQR